MSVISLISLDGSSADDESDAAVESPESVSASILADSSGSDSSDMEFWKEAAGEKKSKQRAICDGEDSPPAKKRAKKAKTDKPTPTEPKAKEQVMVLFTTK